MPRIPEAKQMEMMNAAWRPRWSWNPRFVMFTSYWPDPNYFIAYGTDGNSTFAVRGTWQNDLQPFLQAMMPQPISYVRLTAYPGESVEVVKADGASGADSFLPRSVSTNPADLGATSAEAGAPNSASLCITVPHWAAVARAFDRMLRGPPASAGATT
ncbi:MAG TPA: hypothetical protein VFA20_05035 [Myxococcaceae bacterium]|nr:hypothetical protein [Myxococcaceae bacterium]